LTFILHVQGQPKKEVDFKGPADVPLIQRLAEALPNREHTLELIPQNDGSTHIQALRVFQPSVP